MTVTVSQFRDELADREAIRDCLYRYCRGVDRCDPDMLRSAYWEDAWDDHLGFSGDREALIAWLIPAVRGMDQVMHMTGNILIRLHGDTASVESYFYGIHRVPSETGPRDIIGAGRYADRMEKRNDEWRIAHRTVITDWFRNYPDSGDWVTGPFGMKAEPGGRFPDDRSYGLINLG
jgi:hypothetical protein